MSLNPTERKVQNMQRPQQDWSVKRTILLYVDEYDVNVLILPYLILAVDLTPLVCKRLY